MINLFFTVAVWFLLFAVCWPLALLALILFPLIWIVALPFRLAGVVVHSVFALISAILLFPARLLKKLTSPRPGA